MIRVLSLFSGCGGFDLGFHQEGYSTVWANDFEHWSCESFRANFGDIIREGDIAEIDPNDPSIPDCDIIIGGFPCQDFSVLKDRPGLKTKRGSLFHYFADFVEAKKPLAFVIENVQGILTANRGKALDAILERFEDIEPWYVIKPKLYDFSQYGVPQFRKRVLFVGVRVDTGFDFIHPEPICGPGCDQPYVTAGAALAGVEDCPLNNERQRVSDIVRRLLEIIPEGGNYEDIPKDHPLYVRELFSLCYKRIHRGEPSPTIVSSGGGGTWGYHYPEPRPLTNRERARMQSFPDDFIFCGPLAEVRRQIGNAVPPLGVRPVAAALRPLFTGEYQRVSLEEKLQWLRIRASKSRVQ